MKFMSLRSLKKTWPKASTTLDVFWMRLATWGIMHGLLTPK